MADPTGLVSLGLEGVGGLARVRQRWKRRKLAIKQLAAAVEEADLLVRQTPGDDERARLAEAFAPHVQESIALLERISAQKPVSAAVFRAIGPNGDITAAQRLVEALKAVPGDVEIRWVLETVLSIRQEVRSVRDDTLPRAVAHCRQTVMNAIICASFFERGNPA